MSEVLLNGQIRSQTVRLVGVDNKAEVLPIRVALQRAQDAGLDLVQVADGSPPICKILDGGKYRFEKKKHAREAAAKQRARTIDIKEIQLTARIAPGDLEVKARHAREFLADGDKVRVVLRFKGREVSHKELGRVVMTNFLAALDTSPHKIEQPIRDGGRDLSMVIASTVHKADVVKRPAAA